MKLFGFGNKSEKRTATALPPLLASLFGAEEGQELVVDATESGQSAIAAAESRLQEYNTGIEGHNDAIAKLESEHTIALTEQKTASDKALEEEQTAHQTTKDAFEAFKKEPGATHTTVPHADNQDPDDTTAPVSQIRKDEAEAKAFGEKIAAKKTAQPANA